MIFWYGQLIRRFLSLTVAIVAASGALRIHACSLPAATAAYCAHSCADSAWACAGVCCQAACVAIRSEEHTSELQSLMRISYAVFCLKKNTKHNTTKLKQNNNS